jgi:hypothetical protein
MAFTKIEHYEKEYLDTHHDSALNVTEGVEDQPIVNPYFKRKKRRTISTDEYVEGILHWDSSYDGAEVDRPFSTYYGEIEVSNLTIDGLEAIRNATKDIDGFWSDFVDEHRDELDEINGEDYDDDFESEDD